MRAWLVTWEWAGKHPVPEDQIAAVLNSRLSTSEVKALVECLYLSGNSSPSEKMAIAQQASNNPYPAKVEGETIHCGHHPFLLARLVDDLTVEHNSNGSDKSVSWKEASGRVQKLEI